MTTSLEHAPGLTGLTREGLVALATGWGFRAGQGDRLFNGIHRALALHPEEIDGLNRAFAARLRAEGGWPPLTALADETGEDGARKWLLGMRDGRSVECVFIPEGRRGTLCLSSQVGCSLSCGFCHTGTQGLERNLTAAEIVDQALFVRRAQMTALFLQALAPLRQCGQLPINRPLLGAGAFDRLLGHRRFGSRGAGRIARGCVGVFKLRQRCLMGRNPLLPFG